MNKIFRALLLIYIALGYYQLSHAQRLCDRVSQITVMPFKEEPVDDAAYNALIEAGESVLPCLIAKVADTRKMRDPRQAPGYAGIETRVGDVAYFMLVRVAKLGFIDMFPARVQQRYRTEGVYAYFEFVQKKQNREWLKRKLDQWYRSKHGESVQRGAA
jgi:hypothetical protein